MLVERVSFYLFTITSVLLVPLPSPSFAPFMRELDTAYLRYIIVYTTSTCDVVDHLIKLFIIITKNKSQIRYYTR
jgi:hypothetical protein